ncbi:MAG: hydantoinase/oxoprolinase family protein, partial [Ramlibacter sp.]|nr:hydantoinase/oxoprolinase family protein [Ramlibacter sp.]
GSAFTAAGVEMVTWRVVATGKLDKPALARAATKNGAGVHAPKRRRVHLAGEWHDAEIYDESALTLDGTFFGPAIIGLPDTTIVVGIDQVASVDANRNVIIDAVPAARRNER